MPGQYSVQINTVLARRNGLPYFFVYRSKSKPASLYAFEDSLRSIFSSENRHKLEVSTSHSYKGLQKQKVIVIDAVDRSYPLIHPNWVFSRIFGDTLDEVVAAERRLFYVALTRAIEELVIVTDSKRPSEFLTELNRWANLDTLNWKDYSPAPTENTELHISLKNKSKTGGTYPIKDQIKASGYRWYSGSDSCWRKTVPAIGFDPNKLRNEPWSSAASGVYALIETDDDEMVALFEVEHGRWKELPVPN
jgi:DNA helicase-4